ncbi:MAG: hypothetical protein ABSA75_04250 [Candidatus Bathyarchaeia archaeon]|jgi:hypothetical protein
MPIDKDEFDSGKVLGNIERKIISFLEKNRNKAFESDEIMEGINLQTDFHDFWKGLASGILIFGFAYLLNNLVTCGKIKMNFINGTYYYMAK